MSAMLFDRNAPAASAWRDSLAAWAGVVVLLVLLYWSTLTAMVTIWNRSDTFAHCFLVAPISMWLVWRKRGELRVLHPRPALAAIVPLAGGALAWLLGEMASVNALTQFAFTAMLILSVPLVLGWDLTRRLTFPLAYLLFMVPFGEFLLPWLMEWTADFTVAAVRVSGIPVYREGLQFVIPTGTWSVVEACSGVRYLIASIMVGSLFAYLNYNSTKRRLLFGLVSLAVPLLANWLRAYMIVMLGHLSGNRLAVGVDHLIYGWVFFGLIVGVMFFVGSRWAESPVEPEGPRQMAATSASRALATTLLAASAASLLLIAPKAWLWQQYRNQSQQVPSGPLALAELPGTHEELANPAFVPKLDNPSFTALRSYGVSDGVVFVHVGYYRHQTYGRKLVTSTNAIVNGEDKSWQMTRSGQVSVKLGDDEVKWRRADVLSGTVGSGSGRRQRFDVWQIYWVDGALTASNARATWLSVRGRLAGRGDDSAMITIFTEGDDMKQTQERLDGFVRTHVESLERQLVTYRARR